jgi:small subunit ribosomal protein S20
MANKKSAQKRILQTAKKTEINTMRKSRIRTFIRKVYDAISGGEKETARTALVQAQSEIMRGVTKGVLHRNTGSRKVSRLSAAVKKLCLVA